MSAHFAKIAYTPDVRAMQRRYAGHEARTGNGEQSPKLGLREYQFITARDSFYLATVSETGWPHVQHRGGPIGFIKVLDECTLAFADYGGNRQFISVGNLSGNPRAALILMDYPNRRRLKILGQTEIHPAASAPTALQEAVADGRGAAIERIVTIHIAAFDWNCSQHITPRYTMSELATLEQAL